MSVSTDFFNFDQFNEIGAGGVQQVHSSTTNEMSLPVRHTSTEAPVVSGILTKIQFIKQELNQMFFEREEVIDNALIALTVGQSMLMLGPPGTGKSKLVNELCNRITGTRYFSWLLNKTSDPSELLGPYSLKAMEQDRFVRKTEGRLADCEIAFIDEIFKSNEPTLNILLPLINEKIIYNDGKAQPIPLMSLFAASNEFPEEGEGLEALYDRLVLRMWVDYIKDSKNRIDMYNNYVSSRNGATVGTSYTTITVKELLHLQEEVKKVSATKEVLKSLNSLINKVSKIGITISDRRQNECLKIMQGNALLQGRDKISIDDLNCLAYVLWETVEQIAEIKSIISKLTNPYEDVYNNKLKEFESITANIEEAQEETAKLARTIQSKANLEKIVEDINNTITKMIKAGKDTAKFVELRDKISNYVIKLMNESLGVPSKS